MGHVDNNNHEFRFQSSRHSTATHKYAFCVLPDPTKTTTDAAIFLLADTECTKENDDQNKKRQPKKKGMLWKKCGSSSAGIRDPTVAVLAS